MRAVNFGDSAGKGAHLLVLLLFGLGLAGCLAIAQPRFPPEVAAGIQQAPMRRLETEDITVYYAQDQRPQAERFAIWVGGCVRDLKRWAPIDNRLSQRKPFVIMPEPPLNNAFVMAPALGFETASVVTSRSTFDFLVDAGTAPDPALFGCHEMVHWVHMMQIAGFWGVIDKAFGDVITPQIGLDAWFHEGLATLYESLLQPGMGRMVSPFWEGAFHAGVAGRRLDGGDLSFAKRAFGHGNQYLVGSRFLAFLKQRYGEEKLWQLVQKQATSFFFPLWVSLRFWQVYDKNLSTLIDEFAADVQRRYPVRQRPVQQRRVRDLGHSARYAVARNGTEAVLSEGFDQPPRLEVYAPDGRRLRQRSLNQVLFPRKLVEASAITASGLSLTGDGAFVYFVAIDRDVTFQRARLVRYEVATDRLDIVLADLDGPGGAVSDDGQRYFFARAAGDRHDLAELDLRRNSLRIVVPAAPGVFLGSPRPSPDGQRLVATVAQGNAVHLVMFDRASGAAVGPPIPAPGLAVDPWFTSDGRVLFSGSDQGRFQLFVHDPAAGSTVQVTRAPYLALAARPLPGGGVRFLNREGWSWTLDETTLPGRSPPLAGLGMAVPPAAEPASAAPPASSPPTPAPPGMADLPGAPGPVPPQPPAGLPAGFSPGWLPPALPGPVILSDQPYSGFDHFFYPQLRALSAASLSESGEGFASSLVLLPSFFIRQLELEGFGAAAWDTRTQTRSSLHAAVGGSLTLRTIFWVVPISFRYQVARRLQDDHALVHLIGIAAL